MLNWYCMSLQYLILTCIINRIHHALLHGAKSDGLMDFLMTKSMVSHAQLFYTCILVHAHNAYLYMHDITKHIEKPSQF